MNTVNVYTICINLEIIVANNVFRMYYTCTVCVLPRSRYIPTVVPTNPIKISPIAMTSPHILELNVRDFLTGTCNQESIARFISKYKVEKSCKAIMK